MIGESQTGTGNPIVYSALTSCMTVSIYHSGRAFAGAHFVSDQKDRIPGLLAQLRNDVGANAVEAILLVGVMGTWASADDDYTPANMPAEVITGLGLAVGDYYEKVYKIGTPGQSERVRCSAANNRITVGISNDNGATFTDVTAQATALGKDLDDATPDLTALAVTT